MSLYSPTYQDIENACIGFAHQIDLYGLKFDIIIGVSRGGLVPAVMLSQLLHIPLYPIQYSSHNGNGDNKNHHNILPDFSNMSVLIVDDICDSGHTLKELAEYYSHPDNGNTVYTAAMYFKMIKNPVIYPNLTWVTIPENSEWVVFPWEKYSELYNQGCDS